MTTAQYHHKNWDTLNTCATTAYEDLVRTCPAPVPDRFPKKDRGQSPQVADCNGVMFAKNCFLIFFVRHRARTKPPKGGQGARSEELRVGPGVGSQVDGCDFVRPRFSDPPEKSARLTDPRNLTTDHYFDTKTRQISDV